MSAYRFCRTDDIPLLVDALNRCWGRCFPDDPPMTVARFKREIRDLQVWCSSCMIAFAGSDPIGVLIGAKRPAATLVHRIAVHSDHRRQGHGRHLLTSLSSKLAILGPPKIVAELPGAAAAAHQLFTACGFIRDVCYSDFVLDTEAVGRPLPQTPAGRLVIPVTVDDLEANGLLTGWDPRFCWGRSVETLRARRNEIAGIAVATEERIEAYLLYTAGSSEEPPFAAEILALRSEGVDDGGARIRPLVGRLAKQVNGALRISKVHPEEISALLLEDMGFRRTDGHARYAATARAA